MDQNKSLQEMVDDLNQTFKGYGVDQKVVKALADLWEINPRLARVLEAEIKRLAGKSL